MEKKFMELRKLCEEMALETDRERRLDLNMLIEKLSRDIEFEIKWDYKKKKA